jgi:DNA polymerase III delta prime subunit
VSGTPAGPTSLDEARSELKSRCDAIESAYEFLLAYAAQGLTSDQGNNQVREFLRKCDQAPYSDFIAVLDRDARDARAAVLLVLAQPAISSQLVDNLNASIHLRALLTDLFLIDEVLKTHQRKA